MKKHIDKGLALSLLTSVSKSTKFLFYIFVGQLMGSETLGLFGICWSTVELASKFLLLGLDTVLFRELSISLRHQQTDRFKRSFMTSLKIYGTLALAMCLLMIPGSNFIADHFYQKPELQESLAILAFSVFFRHLAFLFMNAVMANKKMGAQLIVLGIGEPVFSFSGVFLAYFMGGSLAALSFAYALGNLLLLLLSLWCFLREYKMTSLKEWTSQKVDFQILKTSMPLGFSEITSGFLLKLPLFVLGRILTTEEAALFSVGHQVAFSLLVVRTSLAGMILPSIGEFGLDKDFVSIRNRLHHFTLWAAKSIIPLFLVLIFFRGQIMDLLNVKDYHSTDFTVGLFSSLCFFTVFANAELFLLMLKKGHFTFLSHIALLVIFAFIYTHVGTHHDLMAVSQVYAAQVLVMLLIYAFLLFLEGHPHEILLPFHRGMFIDVFILACMSGILLLIDRLWISLDSLPTLPGIMLGGVVACMTFLSRGFLGRYFPESFKTQV